MLENINIKYLKGVGEKRALQFNKLGINSVDALLRFYPRKYEDWSNIVAINNAPYDEKCCVKAVVKYNPVMKRTKTGKTVFETLVHDSTGIMQVVIFNNKYDAQKLHENSEYLFFGKAKEDRGRRVMFSPEIEFASAGEKIRPIYKTTQGLYNKTVETCVKHALSKYALGINNCIPQRAYSKYDLFSIKEAITQIHFPSSSEALQKARFTLAFEELLVLQLGLLRLKGRNRSKTNNYISTDFTEEFYTFLPFELTNSQKQAVNDCVEDMKNDIPMNRLVQGDVGCGKTAVAATVAYTTAKNNMQVAIMAPTEILAKQHYETFTSLLENTDLEVVLLTGSMKTSEKNEVKEKIKTGKANVVIGTHALIQRDVEFEKLGLVITDEQHRFGVNQRAVLADKGKNPNLLVMSATPIPRTLALAIYGDLDVTSIKELPKGRQPVETYRVSSKLRNRAFNYVKKHLDDGKQGYIICPLVEEGESDIASAEEYYERISNNEFKNYSVGLLHGKMKATEKEAVMRDFSDGKIQLLVATVVIEVGVDVPNSVIMLIENAERFGLSQLHQLRGRVGRGKDKSTCILISDNISKQTMDRLSIMCKTTDGFEIADEDLKLRGPGDFFGSKQHGLPELKIADMVEDIEVLRKTGELAKEIIKDDENLEKDENKELKNAVELLFSNAQEV